MVVAFVVLSVTLLFYLLVGWLMRRHHSEFPDLFCGYHVGSRAGLNSDTWNAANEYAGKVLLWAGLGAFLLNAAVFTVSLCLRINRMQPAASGLVLTYLFTLILLPVLLCIVCTQCYLLRRFDENGDRR